ncbi:hypothetical protein HZA56_07590 [Candidatus Poribacteria bacterium]|nr:hypothetical protein [Candidatus Poribacteria bacterium]
MRIARGKVFLILAMLAVGFVTSCALFDKEDEELLPTRKVRVLAFPVRPLEFENIYCMQEMEKIELSGSLKNISYAPISGVQVHAKLYFAGELPSERFVLPLSPPMLQPGQTGTFSLTGKEVSHTVSHVELHAQWQDFVPAGQ